MPCLILWVLSSLLGFYLVIWSFVQYALAGALLSMLRLCLLFFLFVFPTYIPTQSIPPLPPPRDRRRRRWPEAVQAARPQGPPPRRPRPHGGGGGPRRCGRPPQDPGGRPPSPLGRAFCGAEGNRSFEISTIICLLLFGENVCGIFAFGTISKAYGGKWVHTNVRRMHMNAYRCIRTHVDAY